MCISICLVVGLYPSDAHLWGAVGWHPEHGFWRVGLSNWWRRLRLVLVFSPFPISCLRLMRSKFERERHVFIRVQWLTCSLSFSKSYTQEPLDSKTQLLKSCVKTHERWQVPGMFSCHILSWEQFAFEGTSAKVGALLWMVCMQVLA